MWSGCVYGILVGGAFCSVWYIQCICVFDAQHTATTSLVLPVGCLSSQILKYICVHKTSLNGVSNASTTKNKARHTEKHFQRLVACALCVINIRARNFFWTLFIFLSSSFLISFIFCLWSHRCRIVSSRDSLYTSLYVLSFFCFTGCLLVKLGCPLNNVVVVSINTFNIACWRHSKNTNIFTCTS